MSSDTQYLNQEIKKYYNVFGGLLIFTVITVALSYIHVNTVVSVTIALIVATTKASLVASIFMHLAHEQKAIYLIMGMTAFFFTGMLLLIVFGNYSVPQGTEFLNHQDKYKMESTGQHDSTSTNTGHAVEQTHEPKYKEAH